MPPIVFPGPRPRDNLPKDPQTRANIEHVLDHGYVVIPNVFSRGDAEAAKAEIRRLSGSKPKGGRNPFEGLDTNRIYSLLNKTRVFDKYCKLPEVVALNDYFLDPGYQISVLHTIQINPGEKAQGLHHDDAFCNAPRPRPPFGTAILVAFDDFTVENGATRIVPDSHQWPEGRIPRPDETVPMVCPAGSVVYFISLTWHSGGANLSSQPRMSMTVQYCQPYIRPIENNVLGVDPRRLTEIDPEIVKRLGYAVHSGFIGYVDGLNPLRGARRMVRWLQKPLDPSPPTFAQVEDEEAEAARGDMRARL